MRRPHKVVISTAGLAALLAVGLDIWKEYEADRRDHQVVDSIAAFECEVRLCEARGGRWWKGDCQR